MVLINGRKFACEACIRGHRSSSCAHTGRQLQLVRPKGRPSSQCDTCRSKRVNGSFHGRCDCVGRRDDKTTKSLKDENGVETFIPYAGSSSADSQDSSTDGTSGNSKGRHSLDALMNPCQCRTTGECSCCSRGTSSSWRADNNTNGTIGTDGVKLASIDMPASCGCNGGDKCCDDGIGLVINRDDQHPDRVTLTTTGPTHESAAPTKASCCSGLQKKSLALSTAEARIAVAGTTSKASCCGDSRTTDAPESAKGSLATASQIQPIVEEMAPEQAAIMQPDCHCGDECNCPGCLNEGDESKHMRAIGVQSEECPEKCSTCSACVLGLTRPSGIEAIDKWMEEDKAAQEDGTEADRSGSVNSRIATKTSAAENRRDDLTDALDSNRPIKRVRTSVHKHASPLTKPLQPVHPALPPFPHAKAFFNQHFANSEQRQHFAKHMHSKLSLETSQPNGMLTAADVGFGKRIPGESDEQWQARYGFSFLTPEAIEIFDRTKKFREQRRQEEEQDEVGNISTAVSPAPPSTSVDELSQLRQRALAARRSVATTPAST